MARLFREKRKFYRHPIHVPIEIRVESQSPQPHQNLEPVQDLSMGGLCFFWKTKLPKGLSLILSIPVNEKVFKNIHAKVAYCVVEKRGIRYRTGVSFTDSPSAFRAKIAEEALQILNYQRELSRELGRTVSEEEAANRWIERFAKIFPAS